MTQPTHPEVRVGQIWALVDQGERVKITRVDGDGFAIAYLGSHERGSGRRRFSDYRDGRFYASVQFKETLALVSIVYDPIDAS